MHTCTHTYIHTHTHTHIHTYKHTHTHTHKYKRGCSFVRTPRQCAPSRTDARKPALSLSLSLALSLFLSLSLPSLSLSLSLSLTLSLASTRTYTHRHTYMLFLSSWTTSKKCAKFNSYLTVNLSYYILNLVARSRVQIFITCLSLFFFSSSSSYSISLRWFQGSEFFVCLSSYFIRTLQMKYCQIRMFLLIPWA